MEGGGGGGGGRWMEAVGVDGGAGWTGWRAGWRR